MTAIAQEQTQSNDKELNFRKQEEIFKKQLDEQSRMFNEEKERLRKEMEDLRKSQQSSMKQEDEEDDNYDYVDRRQLKKTLSSFQQNIQKEIEEKAEIKARQLIEKEKINDYLKKNPDFSLTMNDQNVIAKFAEENPLIAETLVNMPESFERQKLIFETIKALKKTSEPVKGFSAQQRINNNMHGSYYQPSGISNEPSPLGGDFSEAGMKAAYAKVKELQSRYGIS